MISFILKYPPGGVMCLVFAALIIVIEIANYISFLQRWLDFFIENLLFRAIAYIVFSIPTFFSFKTAIGGIFLVVCGIAYIICWWKGEKGPSTSVQEISGSNAAVVSNNSERNSDGLSRVSSNVV